MNAVKLLPLLVLALVCHPSERSSMSTRSTAAVKHAHQTAANSAARISLVAPAAGQYFLPTETIVVAASAEPAAAVRKIEFFSNGNSIGAVRQPPFRIEYTAPVTGPYVITARATLTSGSELTLGGIRIVVQEEQATTADISDLDVFLLNRDINAVVLKPSSRTVVDPGSDVRILAEAATRNGRIAKVDFLVDDILIGSDKVRPYEVTWKPSPGRHRIAVQAFDDSGRDIKSDPLEIQVARP
jgi:chitinase